MRVVVLGAGGHAGVVLALLTSLNSYEVVALLDDDATKWGSSTNGVSISGPIDAATEVHHDVAVIAVGDNRQRREISQRVRVRWATLIHPHSWVERDVEIGEGSVVFAGSVVQSGSRIGAHVVLNSGADVMVYFSNTFSYEDKEQSGARWQAMDRTTGCLVIDLVLDTAIDKSIMLAQEKKGGMAEYVSSNIKAIKAELQ